MSKLFDKISRNLYQKTEKTNAPEINVSTAFLHLSPIFIKVQLTFKIGHLQFEEHFIVFETLSAILHGFPFDKNEIIFDDKSFAHKRQQQTKTSQQPEKDHAQNENNLYALTWGKNLLN